MNQQTSPLASLAPSRFTPELNRPLRSRRKEPQEFPGAFAVQYMLHIEEIATHIVHCAIKDHKALGPGLLESVYQQCLAYDLGKTCLTVACEVPIPVTYDKVKIDLGFRVDMMVEKAVIIENKTVEKLLPIHEAQLLTYLKLTDLRLGFLLNWNITLMKNGIKRMVNNLKP